MPRTIRLTDASPEMRAATWMALSMVGYVCNDALLRAAVGDVDLYQAIVMRGLLLIGAFWLLMARAGERIDFGILRVRAVAIRVGTEIVATVAYLNALLRMEFADITAIMQFVPLSVTFAAAMLLGESVGWRRYVAIAVGFFGMLVIVRPTGDGVNGWALVVLVAVAMITIRELATRRMPAEVSSLSLSMLTAVAITAMGAVGSLGQRWVAPAPRTLGLLAAAAGFLVLGYLASILTIRAGDIAASAPFRYTGLVWGIVIGWVAFDEPPDLAMLIGSAIIVGASLYSLHRARVVGAPA